VTLSQKPLHALAGWRPHWSRAGFVPRFKLASMRATGVFAITGLLILLAMVAMSFWMLERTRASTDAVLSTREVRSSLVDLLSIIQDAETGQRGYLLTGEARYLQPYEAALRQVEPSLKRLQIALSRSGEDDQLLPPLRAAITAKVSELAQTVALKRAGKANEALAVVLTDRGKETMDAIRNQLRDETARVEGRLYANIDEQRSNANALRWMIVAGGILIVLAGSGAAWALTAYTRELMRARADVDALNSGLEGRIRERTADLQRANDEIQRFAYIVSHDLRAPLVNVMGFTSELETSLAAMQALTADPAIATSPVGVAAKAVVDTDVPEAISFIRTSTQKMDSLINAILKLSREGQRTLNPERVDLKHLFDGIAATAQHRLTETGGELLIDNSLPTIVSDRLALEQIFGNLVDNAIKYRSRERPPVIDVRLREDRGGSIVIEVKDNGRGIGGQDHERVFDLFRRAGPQDQAGEGIGLAHVRALTRRLEGQITLTSELGVGTTFQVKLPRILRIKSEHLSELRS
jgi:signal transduction histidine kinase